LSQERSADAPLIILVVEDEQGVRDVVVNFLEEAGFCVEVAENGDKAIAMLEKPDGPLYRALVTDVDMGSTVNGWDVAHRARELHPELPVIYMTGGRADEWAANGVPNSVLVPKPFAAAQIVTAVAQLLNAGNTSGT
jgi:DNA-binding NtrC family response regulator